MTSVCFTSQANPTRLDDCGIQHQIPDHGEIKGAEGVEFKGAKLGEYTVGGDKTAVLGDPFKFNKDNIDQFRF